MAYTRDCWKSFENSTLIHPIEPQCSQYRFDPPRITSRWPSSFEPVHDNMDLVHLLGRSRGLGFGAIAVALVPSQRMISELPGNTLCADLKPDRASAQTSFS